MTSRKITMSFNIDPMNSRDSFVQITEDAIDAVVCMAMRRILDNKDSEKVQDSEDLDYYEALEEAAQVILSHFEVL